MIKILCLLLISLVWSSDILAKKKQRDEVTGYFTVRVPASKVGTPAFRKACSMEGSIIVTQKGKPDVHYYHPGTKGGKCTKVSGQKNKNCKFGIGSSKSGINNCLVPCGSVARPGKGSKDWCPGTGSPIDSKWYSFLAKMKCEARGGMKVLEYIKSSQRQDSKEGLKGIKKTCFKNNDGGGWIKQNNTDVFLGVCKLRHYNVAKSTCRKIEHICEVDPSDPSCVGFKKIAEIHIGSSRTRGRGSHRARP